MADSRSSSPLDSQYPKFEPYSPGQNGVQYLYIPPGASAPFSSAVTPPLPPAPPDFPPKKKTGTIALIVLIVLILIAAVTAGGFLIARSLGWPGADESETNVAISDSEKKTDRSKDADSRDSKSRGSKHLRDSRGSQKASPKDADDAKKNEDRESSHNRTRGSESDSGRSSSGDSGHNEWAGDNSQTPIPEGIAQGGWEEYSGWVTQDSAVGSASDMSYTMNVSFSGSRGNISYPELGCTGQLIIRSSSGDSYVYGEQITSGTCEQNGEWMFVANGSGGFNGYYTSPSGAYYSEVVLSPAS